MSIVNIDKKKFSFSLYELVRVTLLRWKSFCVFHSKDVIAQNEWSFPVAFFW